MNIRLITLFLSLIILCIADTRQASAFYNPRTGRWLSKDPIAEPGGVNVYAMVGNDSINKIDPFGLDAQNSNSSYYGPFDGKHPQADGCSLTLPCPENFRRLLQWFTAAQTRAANDFTDYWRQRGTRRNWDNHRGQFLDTLGNCKKCLNVLQYQIRMRQCCFRPPEVQELFTINIETNQLKDPGPFVPLPLPLPFMGGVLQAIPGSDATWGNIQTGLYIVGGGAAVVGTGGVVLGALGAGSTTTTIITGTALSGL